MTVSDKQYGVVAPDVLLSHSGLEFLQAIVGGKLPNPPICKVLNFHLAEVGEGRVAFEGTFAQVVALFAGGGEVPEGAAAKSWFPAR